ncbi:hypothetical protein [Klebsiella pneumoniae]|uniref:hypothetical protein n=1 Tax=Klebsiella pneumoniae TaxID=573 RepID=UPI00067E8DD9|nr:hypothetical protein [Klebsiella pneumoniae]
MIKGAVVACPCGEQDKDTQAPVLREVITAAALLVHMLKRFYEEYPADYGDRREDLRRVVEAAAPVPTKVILETHYLNEEQIRRRCHMSVSLGMEGVQTSSCTALAAESVGRVSICADRLNGLININEIGGIRVLA